MKLRTWVVAMVFCAGCAILSSQAWAQAKEEKKTEPAKPAAAQPPAAKPADKPAGDKPAAKPADKPGVGATGGMPPEMEAMMKAAQPGEFHAKLKPLAGKWTFTTKFRMSPDQPWEESTGKGEKKWAMGGRYLFEEVKANPSEKDAEMGGPFEGFGIIGYDNVSKKYFNVWADNMGTGIMTSTGTIDSSGKTITYTGEYNCPMIGREKTVKSIQKIVGDDKVVFEMYDKGPDGKEFMNLEVTYTRQK